MFPNTARLAQTQMCVKQVCPDARGAPGVCFQFICASAVAEHRTENLRTEDVAALCARALIAFVGCGVCWL